MLSPNRLFYVSTRTPSVIWGFIPRRWLQGHKVAATTPAFVSTFKAGKKGRETVGFSYS